MNQARELCIQPSIVVDTADCLYSAGSYSAAAMPADERWNAGGYALQLSLPRAALHASLVGRFDPWIRLNHPPPTRTPPYNEQTARRRRAANTERQVAADTHNHAHLAANPGYSQHEHTAAAAAAAAGGSQHAQAIVCKHQQASIICRINNTTSASNDI